MTIPRAIDRLLEYGERLTRMNLRSFIAGLSWLSLNQAVGIVSALALALAYAHFLPQEVYGTYKYILAIIGTLTVFALPGMDSAAQKWIANGNENVFWPTFRKRLEWSGVAVAIGIGIGVYYLLHGNQALAYSFFVAAPFLLVLDPFGHFNALLIGRQQYRKFSYYSAAIQVATSIIIFAAVLLSRDVVVIIAAYFAAFVLARGIALWHLVAHAPPDNTAEHDEEAIRYGAHFSVINVIGIGASQLDAILLFHFLGPVALAVYSFAQASADQARKVFKVATSVMAFPKLAALDTDVIKRELPHKILVAHLATVPLAVILILIIPYFYNFLFPQYAASIPYAQVMAGVLAFSPIRLISTAINAKGSINQIYLMNISASVIKIALLIVLIPLYGIWGAVLATPLQSVLSNILFIRIFKKL